MIEMYASTNKRSKWAKIANETPFADSERKPIEQGLEMPRVVMVALGEHIVFSYWYTISIGKEKVRESENTERVEFPYDRSCVGSQPPRTAKKTHCGCLASDILVWGDGT